MFPCTVVQIAAFVAQSSSQDGKLLPSYGAGVIVKQVSPPAAMDGPITGEAFAAAKTGAESARLPKARQRARRRRRDIQTHAYNQRGCPLVARELVNRDNTIAAAFGREAWTYAAASRP
jgi:hypothetical protein